MTYLIVLVGKTGSGKTYVSNKLKKEYFIPKIITCTTRNIRPGEIDGVNYRFYSHKEFESLINNNEMLEYVIREDNYYGIRKKDLVVESTSTIVVDLDGAKLIKSLLKDRCIVVEIQSKDHIRQFRCIQDKRLDDWDNRYLNEIEHFNANFSLIEKIIDNDIDGTRYILNLIDKIIECSTSELA